MKKRLKGKVQSVIPHYPKEIAMLQQQLPLPRRIPLCIMTAGIAGPTLHSTTSHCKQLGCNLARAWGCHMNWPTLEA